MKKNLLYCLTAISLLFFPQFGLAQKTAIKKVTYQTTAVNPNLLTTDCYAIFTASGEITNVNSSTVTGDIGTNLGTATGFEALKVTGEIHTSPDVSTGIAASDVNTVYNELNAMSFDTQLANPAMFGNDMILNAQSYLLNAATILSGNLYLDAEGNSNAVFIFHVVGAFSSVINSRVILTNGTQAKNIYWKVVGAVDLAANTDFAGTIVSKDGAISIGSGSSISGRLLTTNGAISTNAVTIAITSDCNTLISGVSSITTKNKIGTFYPNPWNSSLKVTLNNVSITSPAVFKLYNTIGRLVFSKVLTNEISVIQTDFPAGVYFYQLTSSNESMQSGKLIKN
jgi:hypothetical protein